MRIKNVTAEAMRRALKEVNKSYQGNVTWNCYEATNRKETSFHFTLRVKSSGGKGARRGRSGRRMVSACWHVHGNFFENILAICPDAVIRAGTLIINKDGGNWQDRNIGSMADPLMHSDACECI